MPSSENFSITKSIKISPPIAGPIFLKMKEKILGKDYILSVVFIGKKKSQSLNNKYRGKNSSTDILSFPINEKEGEIFINLDEARRKARLHGREFKNYLYFLFIHGLIHLKGFDHSSRMEEEEKKYRIFFRI